MTDCAPLPSSFHLIRRLHFRTQTPRFSTHKKRHHPKLPPISPAKFSIKTSVRNSRSEPSEVSGAGPLRDGEERQRMSPSYDFLELKRELEGGEERLAPVEGLGEGSDGGLEVRRGGRRQIVRRSSLLAKQVISIRTARSLGFVSQLWVDTRSWIVVLVEVRPNLLSGEVENCLLDDVCQVGDVVLVQDEGVMENDHKMIGLDTLVGYSVVTSGRRKVGKVRGYTFNINSGGVESLELDSFGFSVIPASLVSTYSLFVEDVLEVASDTVIVQEGAASRVQRLTKGIWDSQNANNSLNDIDERYDFGRQRRQSSKSRRSSRDHKLPREMRAIDDDWEFPMEY